MNLSDKKRIAEAKVVVYYRESTLQIGKVLVGVDDQGCSAILTGHEDPFVLTKLEIFDVSYFCGTAAAEVF